MSVGWESHQLMPACLALGEGAFVPVARAVGQEGAIVLVAQAAGQKRGRGWTIALPCPQKRSHTEGILAARRMREARYLSQVDELKDSRVYAINSCLDRLRKSGLLLDPHIRAKSSGLLIVLDGKQGAQRITDAAVLASARSGHRR